MRRETEIALSPPDAADPAGYKAFAARHLGVPAHEVTAVRLLKRSVDSRSRHVLVRLRLEVFLQEEEPVETPYELGMKDVSRSDRVVIVGAGPAGLFAALTLIRAGLRPVILERGKEVSARKRDIALLQRKHLVNPDSNYCYGEGGAGTFSDGKLYTRSTKKGDVGDILNLLAAHGAPREILTDAHPHIGTDKLPAVIRAIRNTILEAGGEIHFGSKCTGLIIAQGAAVGVTDQSGNQYTAKAVILATGHSARETYDLLHGQGLLLQPKGFAAGVRVEHPQELIDRIQYHGRDRGAYLPPAAYTLVAQSGDRGVFSFCMCPGGTIVPSATGDGQVVVNGMSNAARNSPWANAGIVVQVEPEDLADYRNQGAFAGIRFQEEIEKAAYLAGGASQAAPAQRLMDFMERKNFSVLPATSYFPGIVSCPIDTILPGFVTRALREGFRAFGKKMPGFLTNEAVIVGVESRTSSPVRIPRDETTLEHLQLKNLYPCGEGAGYAGGIISSAIDGVRCATAASGKIRT